MMLSLLATLVAAPFLRAAPDNRPFAEYQLNGLSFKQVGLLDRICIVRATGRMYESRPVGAKDPRQVASPVAEVSVEGGIVVDGPGKGGSVRLVSFDAADDSESRSGSGIWPRRRPAWTVGQRYLVLGVSPQEGHLYQEGNLAEARYLKEGRYIRALYPEDVSLLTAFPTQAASLPTASDPATRLLNALIDALPAVHGWDRERLVGFLGGAGDIGHDSSGVHPETPASLRLRAMARAAADPTLQVTEYSILMDWGIAGVEGAFFTALMDVADLPDLLADLPDEPYFVRPGAPGNPPESYQIVYDNARANRLAALASNDAIRRYLFEHVANDPTAADKALYVHNFGRESREFVDRVMLKRFARWDREPDKEPVPVRVPGKDLPEVTNHDVLVAYWKAKYPGG